MLPKKILPNATKYTTKLHKKNSIEKNRSSSLEKKGKITRMEVVTVHQF